MKRKEKQPGNGTQEPKKRQTARDRDPRTLEEKEHTQPQGDTELEQFKCKSDVVEETMSAMERQFQIEQPRATTAEPLIQTLVTTRNRRGKARSTRGREHSLARCCGAAARPEVKSESSSTRVTENKR